MGREKKGWPVSKKYWGSDWENTKIGLWPKSGMLAPFVCVCVRGVFFTLNRSFYPSTSSTTIVRADSSILEERSQSYATEILLSLSFIFTNPPEDEKKEKKATYQVPGTRYAVSTAVGNAMPCHNNNKLDTTGTTYTFYAMKKWKETIREENKRAKAKIRYTWSVCAKISHILKPSNNASLERWSVHENVR